MLSLQMQSCVHENGQIQCAIFEVDIPSPSENEVTVKIEASPINPSDLGLMFSAAPIESMRAAEYNGHPSLILDLPPKTMKMMSTRVGQWLPVGNEACGVVVKAGSSDAARALLGKRVGLFGGAMYAEYRTISVFNCMLLPERVTPEQGASCFVNPMTALGFVETMKSQDHKGIIHTAAASNLGQMLNRICVNQNIPLVNIVRTEAQVELLQSQGAKHVINCSSAHFPTVLINAVKDTGATLGFDAIGGGKLVNALLMAMESASVERMPAWSRYGSDEHKQVYIYGALDVAPTTLTRGYGFAWSVGGWLLTPFMRKVGLEKVVAMQKLIVSEITTTFASQYSDRISLSESMKPEIGARYGVRKTGQKALIVFT